MACNCATEEEINKLYDAYGVKLREGGDTFKDHAKRVGLFIASIFMWIVAFPLTLIFVLATLFWRDDRKVNIQNINILRLVNKLKNVGKQ